MHGCYACLRCKRQVERPQELQAAQRPHFDVDLPEALPRFYNGRQARRLLNQQRRVSNGSKIVQDTGQIRTENLQVNSMAESAN
eukprot:5660346-Amphidinium_carterae.1